MTTATDVLRFVRGRYNLVVLFTTLLFFGFSETIGISWIKAFIKSGNHQTYLISFYVAMYLGCLILSRLCKSKSGWLILVIGFMLGYIASVISIFLLGIIEGGFSRWIDSYLYFGQQLLGVFIWGPLITGGWLIGTFFLATIKTAYTGANPGSTRKESTRKGSPFS